MSETITHHMMMLRPLQAGLSGYARLQGEPGRQLVQMNLRGLQGGEMRVFWYAGEGLVREIGRSRANQRGEATLCAEVPTEATAPRRLVALLMTDGDPKPRPLAIGLCTAQSAGSLLDAKNALLALCDKLGREAAAPKPSERATAEKTLGVPAGDQEKTADCKHCAHKRHTDTVASGERKASVSSSKAKDHSQRCKASKTAEPALPREVFLPAIEGKSRPERRRSQRWKKPDATERASMEPTKASSASGKAVHERGATTPTVADPVPASLSQAKEAGFAPDKTSLQESTLPTVGAAATPTQAPQASAARTVPFLADELPALQWPKAFRPLADYFAHYPPTRLMNWPGWRFVHVPGQGEGLWIGYCQKDDHVSQVAYALPAHATPPKGRPFQPATAADGQSVQLLVLQP